ncbi:MauE/DoxX family redox-associated membrane protein [Membranihabitans maritimus]|uniref:MauE/DoxX family redox-associated membrane protein n=1 Tax=Membranihabitans maritimus TaxID=2904244 RepID=UPI001F457AD4|nr:MauE/DoxX family redox-associated membrane protein [Membranihabitans maritimus]
MHWARRIENGTVLIMIVVFAYTGISKLWAFDHHIATFRNQPLPTEWENILAYIIPFSELITVILLIFLSTRRIGLVLSLVLMTIFSTYVGLVVARGFDRIPCSCGGIFSSMDWKLHWLINIFLTSLLFFGVIMQGPRKKPGSDCG